MTFTEKDEEKKNLRCDKRKDNTSNDDDERPYGNDDELRNFPFEG